MPCSPTCVRRPSGRDFRKSCSPRLWKVRSRRAGSGEGAMIMFSRSEPENSSGRWGTRATCSRRSNALMSLMLRVSKRISPALGG